MNKEYFVNHPQDKKDAFDALNVPYPYKIIIQRTRPTEQGDEYTKWLKQQAYFHRSIVPELANADGISEDEAKALLQIKFARCDEVVISEAGEHDLVWRNEDKFRVFEEGKMFQVESVGDMASDRLSEFIEKCKNWLLIQYGVIAKEYIGIKTKKIKK